MSSKFRLTTLTVALIPASSILAVPLGNSSSFITIPLEKRLPGLNESYLDATDLRIADMNWMTSATHNTENKYDATLTAYELNTGNAIPGMSCIADRLAKKILNLDLNLKERGTAAVGLTPQNGQSYWTGSIQVGTPPQNFVMNFDTGSADLWVPASSCSSCSGSKYDPSKSSTSKNQDRKFSIQYGDGSSTSGQVYKDTVNVAGLAATGQAVGFATSKAVSGNFDGIVGMAYQSLSTQRAPPLFQTLVNNNVVPSGVFSFRLSTSGSELYLGGTNSARYTGNINYSNVINKQYWQIALGSVKVNGQTIATSNAAAIIDTGTTMIYSPSSAAKAFYAAYPKSLPVSSLGYSASKYPGYYGVPCSGNRYVNLAFGGVQYTIPTGIFTQVGYIGNQNGIQYCLGGLVGNDNMGIGNNWLVGDTFLSSVYSVFDITNNKVGFATLS